MKLYTSKVFQHGSTAQHVQEVCVVCTNLCLLFGVLLKKSWYLVELVGFPVMHVIMSLNNEVNFAHMLCVIDWRIFHWQVAWSLHQFHPGPGFFSTFLGRFLVLQVRSPSTVIVSASLRWDVHHSVDQHWGARRPKEYGEWYHDISRQHDITDYLGDEIRQMPAAFR